SMVMKLEGTTLFTGLVCSSLLLALGCSGGDDPDTDASPATGSTDGTPRGSPTVAPPAPGSTMCPTGMDDAGNLLVMAAPANNYSFSSKLSFPPQLVAPQTELTFNWSQVTQDFLGHPLDPMADIDNLMVMLWVLT